MHRPGAELAGVTARTAEAMLFDGPVALETAQRQHDGLVGTLRDLGAQVEYVEDLLAEALEEPGERERLLVDLAADAPPAVRAMLAGLAPAKLACKLIGGVPDDASGPNVRRHPGSAGWHVAPLPNLLFPRDIMAVLGDAVHVAHPARTARRREGRLAAAIARTDPALRAAGRWSEHELSVEGGDVLLPGEGVAVIGIGPRTRSSAAKALARRLLGGGSFREVVAVCMPADGPFHLDLAMTLVDDGTVLVDRSVIDRAHAVRWRLGAPPQPQRDALEAIGEALGGELRVVEAADDHADRPWDHGANVVAVRPGTVVAYADNRATQARLEAAGIEVVPVDGDELGRGRGGPRCLTCPLVRG